MAALSDLRAGPVVDLRHVRTDDLMPALEEAVRSWREQLAWDFQPSADLVRRFVSMQALSGFALYDAGVIAGYGYYVCEEAKGLIGDLYVMERHRSVERENLLLGALLDSMWRTPGIRRVETQLLMLRSPLDRSLPFREFLSSFPRCFLQASLQDVSHMPPRSFAGIDFEPWAERRQEDAAISIAAAYQDHIDAQINDQYRSVSGARRFLSNIIQYPGCGAFFAPASFLAISRPERRVCGLCLASLVASNVGHITQICVLPGLRRTGLGYELLRRSLGALAEHRCDNVSLTVTSANLPAIRLYERLGFVNRRDFAAYVWEAP
jgi:ribosomal protein S18 acetylase RimI-like enzyme